MAMSRHRTIAQLHNFTKGRLRCCAIGRKRIRELHNDCAIAQFCEEALRSCTIAWSKGLTDGISPILPQKSQLFPSALHSKPPATPHNSLKPSIQPPNQPSLSIKTFPHIPSTNPNHQIFQKHPTLAKSKKSLKNPRNWGEWPQA